MVDSFWDIQIKRGLETKIRNAKLKARGGVKKSKDFALQHPDWVRDAQKKDYTQLVKIITQQEKDRVALAMQRREKIKNG